MRDRLKRFDRIYDRLASSVPGRADKVSDEDNGYIIGLIRSYDRKYLAPKRAALKKTLPHLFDGSKDGDWRERLFPQIVEKEKQ